MKPTAQAHAGKKIFAAGFSLVELLVAVVIVSIGALALLAAAGNVQKVFHSSKTRSMAYLVVQDQIRALKQRDYQDLRVTKNPALLPGLNISYDTTNYPPEQRTTGGLTYDVYTLVQQAHEANGEIVPGRPTDPDAGIRLITVTSVHTTPQGEKKVVQASNYLSQPNTMFSSVALTGTVSNKSTLLPIPGATIIADESMGWQTVANGSGEYKMGLVPGTFRLLASARGYYPVQVNLALNPKTSPVQDFALTAIGTGAVRGAVWIADHLVISHVVGRHDAVVTGTPRQLEYIEIFNPTNVDWKVNAGGSSPGLEIVVEKNGALSTLSLNLNKTVIEPKQYYLIANNEYVMRPNGGLVQADAHYNGDHIDTLGTAGGVGLRQVGGGTWIDRVGWTGNVAPTSPGLFEGVPVADPDGLRPEEGYARKCSTAGFENGVGRAYDAHINAVDFAVFSDLTTSLSPMANTTAVIESTKAATPAIDTLVMVSDGLSLPAQAQTVLEGGMPVAVFNVPDVATGTHAIMMLNNGLAKEIANVTVWQDVETDLGPHWLDEPANYAVIAGQVTDANGLPIAGIPGIQVGAEDGSPYVQVDPQGRYLLKVSPGARTITANPNHANPAYVSKIYPAGVAAALGKVTSDVNFRLPQSRVLRGFITRDGVTPLPDMAVIAVEAANSAMPLAHAAADVSGNYHMRNLSTGSYFIRPVLRTGEIAVPDSFFTVVAAGADELFVGTFTISGALGEIQGTLTQGGKAVNAGGMVVVSTIPFSTPANVPAFNAANSKAGQLYTAAVNEKGAYSVKVVGGTSADPMNYYVYAYMLPDGTSAPPNAAQFPSAVAVLSGATVANVNFSW